MSRLLVFGYSYTARAFVARHRPRFGRVAATARTTDGAERIAAAGLAPLLLDGDAALRAEIALAEALLVSAPPDEAGDPLLRRCGEAIGSAPRLGWIGYLSTIGVYGDQGGAWIDETAQPRPSSARNVARLAAERAWLDLGVRLGIPVHVLRLAGIYGPGRNALANLRAGTAKRVVKPGQVFNRIHVDDIAGAIGAALDRPEAAGITNVTDDEPSPPGDVVAHAAALLGMAPPPEVPFEAAAFTPMARSFWGETKRVSNRRLKRALGVRLLYPTYREGLAALAEAGEGRDA